MRAAGSARRAAPPSACARPRRAAAVARAREAPEVRRRVALASSALLAGLSGAPALGAEPAELAPLDDYAAALRLARRELGESFVAVLERCVESGAPPPVPALRRRITARGSALGDGWFAAARGADAYLGVERNALAREQNDLFRVLPERAGPLLSAALSPNWDDPDDKHCLLYACVNDPDAPPSIDALYALKLLQAGLELPPGKASAEGLLYNAQDALEKVDAHLALVDEALAAGAKPPRGAAAPRVVRRVGFGSAGV